MSHLLVHSTHLETCLSTVGPKSRAGSRRDQPLERCSFHFEWFVRQQFRHVKHEDQEGHVPSMWEQHALPSCSLCCYVLRGSIYSTFFKSRTGLVLSSRIRVSDIIWHLGKIRSNFEVKVGSLFLFLFFLYTKNHGPPLLNKLSIITCNSVIPTVTRSENWAQISLLHKHLNTSPPAERTCPHAVLDFLSLIEL